MENTVNQQQSLKIISEMIALAKTNLGNYGTWTSLYWGYAVSVTALLNFLLLKFTSYAYYSFRIWVIMIPAAILYFFLINRELKKIGAKNHIDSIISRTWLCFMIMMIFMQVLFWSMPLPGNVQFIYFTPIVLLMLGVAQNITGFVCKYKPLVYCSLIYSVGALACGLLSDPSYQFLILAVCMLIGMVVPGHMLRTKTARNV